MRRAHDIPAAMINLRIVVAESFGANRMKILHKAGIDPEIFDDPKFRVSVGQTMNVWREIVHQTGSHEIG